MKKILWALKRKIDSISGTVLNEYYWRFRHLFKKQWTENYLATMERGELPRFFAEAIRRQAPFDSLLEVGAAVGNNLYHIKKLFPDAQYYGIDISGKAVQAGNDWLKAHSISNIKLSCAKAEDLKAFGDKSVDVVMTNATLIYIGPDKIEKVIKEMLRVAKKSIVLVEFWSEKESDYISDHWAYNWKILFEKSGQKNITITKLTPADWQGDWGRYGAIIEVMLARHLVD